MGAAALQHCITFSEFAGIASSMELFGIPDVRLGAYQYTDGVALNCWRFRTAVSKFCWQLAAFLSRTWWLAC